MPGPGARQAVRAAPGAGEISPGTTRLVDHADISSAESQSVGTADALIESIRAYDDDVDAARIRRAFEFGRDAHEGQKRASGAPYFTHPIAVARIITDMKLDEDSVITALLHDTVEDCETTFDDLRREFGEDVALLVEGVTKLSKLATRSSGGSVQAENLRKLLLAMSEDIRVLLVKLADRLHNMRTISSLAQEKQVRISRETLDLFSPLAERVGLTYIQSELEETAFKISEAERYESISNRIKHMSSEQQETIEFISLDLKEVFERIGMECSVAGRMKTPYSIWRKMKRKKVPLDQLPDIVAFRVLVPSEPDCYRALGELHKNYRSVMGRFKDYISTPKQNGYRSLHTGIIGPQSQKIEVQIRTPKMHEIAEFGVAAHWDYKQGGKGGGNANLPKIKWIKELVGLLDEEEGVEEFLEHTKLDLYRDHVFCFTPRGALIELPRGATAVDFAYEVHTKIGDTCTGVRINNKTRQLATVLENGDQVEILTEPEAKPLAEWETFVMTGRAKSAIRRFHRVKRVNEFRRIGEVLVKKTFRDHKKSYRSRLVVRWLGEFGVSKVEELYALVGEGRVMPIDVLGKLHPDLAKKKSKAKRADDEKAGDASNKPKFKIEGDIAGHAVTMAQCCHPLPGEGIVGIFTTGKGLTVHKKNCDTLDKFHDSPELWFNVSWDDKIAHKVNGRLDAVLCNEPGSLASLASDISSQGGNISNLHLTERSTHFFRFEIDLEVDSLEHMRSIIAVLQSNELVESVQRADVT